MKTAWSETSPDLQRRVENFLYHEAFLLDERRFSSWLKLLTDDAVYKIYGVQFVGQRRGAGAVPPTYVLLANDDRNFLRVRARRLEKNLAGCEHPPSLTRHFVSNVVIRESDGNEFEVASYLAMYQNRNGANVIFGRRLDRLREQEGKLLLAERNVYLDHGTLPRTLSVFV